MKKRHIYWYCHYFAHDYYNSAGRLGTQITNKENEICLLSSNAIELTGQQRQDAGVQPVYADKNTLVISHPIRCGCGCIHNPCGRRKRNHHIYDAGRDVSVKATFKKKTVLDEAQVKAFVERLYNNILGRAGDEEGINSWVTIPA